MVLIFYSFLHKAYNVRCGYPLEVPQCCISDEYPQLTICFCREIGTFFFIHILSKASICFRTPDKIFLTY